MEGEAPDNDGNQRDDDHQRRKPMGRGTDVLENHSGRLVTTAARVSDHEGRENNLLASPTSRLRQDRNEDWRQAALLHLLP